MRKILIIFYYLGATYMYMLVFFFVAYPSIHILHICISNPFYRLETSPILQSHVIPVFIRRIAPPPHLPYFFGMAMLFGVPSSNVLEPQINRSINPLPFPQLHVVFLKIHISPPFSGVIYVTPYPPFLNPTKYFWS